MLAPWATVSCCSGSSHCSALCNYTVYNPPPLYSFSESVTPLPLPRSLVRFCSSAMLLVVQRASRRSWSRRGRRLRSNSRLRVPPSPSPSNPCSTHSIRPLLVRLDLLARFLVTGCILTSVGSRIPDNGVRLMLMIEYHILKPDASWLLVSA